MEMQEAYVTADFLRLHERIRRLEAERDRWKRHADSYLADILELRAALQTADNTLSTWLAHGYGQSEQYVKMREARDLARHALEGK